MKRERSRTRNFSAISLNRTKTNSHLLTLQASTDEHPKPPPLQGSEKDIFTETFRAFVNAVEAIIDAVGGTVSAKQCIVKILANSKGEY